MAAVSETIVREYFELHEFLVRQHRKFISATRQGEDDDIDFFVLNPRPEPITRELPFVLTSADLRFLHRAVVVVKGWHTETFSTSRLANAPEIFRFVQPKVFQQAARAFGPDGAPLKILVVPALPQQTQARDQSIGLLRSKGIDAVIPFHTMLAELIAAVEPNRNYQKSDLLQILRILKIHDLVKEPQLELFKGKKRRSNRRNEGREPHSDAAHS
jgi:hypothetical protein